ncbi:MAG: hypothetical protein GTO45_00040 [Candidatus Aminicenantes bacterium]|nr:hypothetical protein [Candidatus Aminicenantes bacterium]NIM77156.1 hypothetical protein [Candidatus Aminicenantes bacterium]NIN16449.1 hypothetical protein [Candidatus Aminicenantes bacterium]NIN40310.1 hypothetical protein [Candidatus Aminicenantes bacterium]NIN83129.1 hypothetical protein [Candidatus Aminicenantes bacterium]
MGRMVTTVVWVVQVVEILHQRERLQVALEDVGEEVAMVMVETLILKAVKAVVVAVLVVVEEAEVAAMVVMPYVVLGAVVVEVVPEEVLVVKVVTQVALFGLHVAAAEVGAAAVAGQVVPAL